MRTVFLASLRWWVAAALVIGLSRPTHVLAQGRPMIEHIEPTSGPPGTRVSIIGRGFRPTVRVLFAEHPLPLVERLPERVTVEVPAGAQSGRFVIAHGTDEVESDVFRVTAREPPPRVTAVEPASGAPGSEIVLRGENFAARPTDNQVRIGTLPMVVRSGDPTSLRVIIPEGATTGPITVRTPGGESASPPVTIAARVGIRDFTPIGAAPGGHVTLRGSGFGTNVAAIRVTVGGHPARVIRAVANEIEIEIARDAQGGGPIVVDVQGAGRFETGSSLTVAPAPIIRAVEPPQASPGARVQLRGERFGTNAAAVRVTLGDVVARVISVGPGEIVTEVPARAGSGRWNVTVAGIGPVQSPTDYTVLTVVSIASVAPPAADVGDRVTITGTGFALDPTHNHVLLGGTESRIISVTGTEIVVEVPQARSGLWMVRVDGNGEARTRSPFMVTLRPRITAIEPDRGVIGDRVTLRGLNFPAERPLVQVRLGDVECVVDSTSREAIVVRVPRGLQPGPARFSVVGRLQGTGHAPMEYFVLVPTRITGIEPPAAPVGATVVVRGEGFEADVRQLRFRLGATVIRPRTVATASIEFVVPRGAVTGDIAVEAPMRQTATSRFIVQIPPVVRSFSPAQGAPGSRVTIRGRNFGTEAAAVSVTLGGTACTVATAESTSVVVELPADATTGRFAVTVRDQGTANAPRDFRITTSRPTQHP